MSKNMMQWTLGLLVVGCMLAMAAPAGAGFTTALDLLDSADFDWQYEMDAKPSDTDLDSIGGGDFNELGSGGSSSVSGGILTMATTNVYYYDNLDSDQTWNLDPDITYEKGFTFECRMKITSGTRPRGYTFLATPDPSTDIPGAWLSISYADVKWSSSDDSLGGGANNDDVFHIFRVVQKPGETLYGVWRDGVLLSDSLGQGYNDAIAKIAFGALGDTWGTGAEIDYLRFTSGAYAPIPEPGTLILLAGALLSLLVWRRR
jgi:hypothetical protein